jgi:hypothetical protein
MEDDLRPGGDDGDVRDGGGIALLGRVVDEWITKAVYMLGVMIVALMEDNATAVPRVAPLSASKLSFVFLSFEEVSPRHPISQARLLQTCMLCFRPAPTRRVVDERIDGGNYVLDVML